VKFPKPIRDALPREVLAKSIYSRGLTVTPMGASPVSYNYLMKPNNRKARSVIENGSLCFFDRR
jgi:hypothetical protein